MNYKSLFVAFAFGASISSCAQSKKSDTPQPGQRERLAINLADPTMIYTGNTYYLFGTNDHNSGNGFIGYSSTDGDNWKEFTALTKGDAFGTTGFWAPQIFPYNNKWYMAYTANENIAIASADNPNGPFKQSTIKQLEAPVKQIDPFVFTDDNGKKYLYHVRLTNGNRIFVAEMNDDLSAINESTLKECISGAVNTQPWENTQNVDWTVTEGVTVLKHKGKYYMIYSANDFRNIDYAVGYAVADNPLGPWVKYSGNPIISRKDLGINGTGHGDFFTDKDGNLEYVFHTHNSNTTVGPRKTAVIKASFVDGGDGTDKIVIDPKTFHYLLLP
ncbi:glycoside hydrolase family 43 protein [Chitinophagaceae bacterium 26-R-25]|nr:glycoside hydrolase family 43 protein [Chitinophagaceae bacterium 26-R-25]